MRSRARRLPCATAPTSRAKAGALDVTFAAGGNRTFFFSPFEMRLLPGEMMLTRVDCELAGSRGTLFLTDARVVWWPCPGPAPGTGSEVAETCDPAADPEDQATAVMSDWRIADVHKQRSVLSSLSPPFRSRE